MSRPEHAISDADLDAYVDSRLPPADRAAVEAYLRENAAAAARVAADIAAREALRRALAPAAAEPIPARLRIGAIRARLRERRLARLRTLAAGLALLLAGGAGGWIARDQRGAAARPVLTATSTDAIAAFRLFTAEVAHPVEVAASQQAHLVQWLSRRVGHKLTVPDLAAQGYVLMGGRALPIAQAAPGQAAAQFMYENKSGQRLTLYIRATIGEDTAFRFVEAEKVGAFSWVEDGLSFAMVGALDRPALLAIADAVYRQINNPAGKGGL